MLISYLVAPAMFFQGADVAGDAIIGTDQVYYEAIVRCMPAPAENWPAALKQTAQQHQDTQI